MFYLFLAIFCIDFKQKKIINQLSFSFLMLKSKKYLIYHEHCTIVQKIKIFIKFKYSPQKEKISKKLVLDLFLSSLGDGLKKKHIRSSVKFCNSRIQSRSFIIYIIKNRNNTKLKEQ